tara:strand:+ start:123 stop:359 length:237 start_codon:yes stop_codon:yes gene_type:complete
MTELVQQLAAGGAALGAALFGLLIYIVGRKDAKKASDKRAEKKLEEIKRDVEDIDRIVRTSSDADIDKRLRDGGWLRK